MLRGINKEAKKFIVYIHINPTTKEIFYVGIGVRGRQNQKYKRSDRWKAYVAKYGFEPNVVYSELNWYEAGTIEKKLIDEIGRVDTNSGTLINMTNGGDGSSGYEGFWKGKSRPPATEETKQKCRDHSQKFWQGKKHSEETRVKIKEKRALQDMSWRRGKKLNFIIWNKGVKMWENKIAPKPMLGRKASEETKRKKSISMMGKRHTQETKDKIGAKHKGKVVSLEVRQKISNTLKKTLAI